MDIPFFDDPNRVPKPRDQIKITAMQATPYPDRFRVRIGVSVTPFQERPNLLLVVRDDQQRIISELSVIETMHADMEFTVHIRNTDDPAGEYTFDAELYYDTRNPPQDRGSLAFTIPPADD